MFSKHSLQQDLYYLLYMCLTNPLLQTASDSDNIKPENLQRWKWGEKKAELQLQAKQKTFVQCLTKIFLIFSHINMI